jgi:hypothetical protein
MRLPCGLFLLLVLAGCAGRYEPPTMRVVRREELPLDSRVKLVPDGASSTVTKATRKALQRSGFKVVSQKEDTGLVVARLSADCRGRLQTRCSYFGLRFVNPATTEIVGDVTLNPVGGSPARLGSILDTLVARLKRTPRQ